MAGPWEKYTTAKNVVGGSPLPGPWEKFAPPKEEPGILGQAKEFITGERRATEATEQLPEIGESGLLAGLDQGEAAKITYPLLFTSDPNEMAQILKNTFPEDIAIKYDKNIETGDIFPIAHNRKTGATAVLNKPGLSTHDLMSTLGLTSLYTIGGPAGAGFKRLGSEVARRAPAVASAARSLSSPLTTRAAQFAAKRPTAAAGVAGAAESGAITAGVEGLQAGAGGEFNEENVIMDLITGGFLDAVPAWFKARQQKKQELAQTKTEEARAAEAARIGDEFSPERQQAAQQELTRDIATQQAEQQAAQQELTRDIAIQQAEQQVTQQELLRDVAAAAREPSRLEQLRELPGDVAPDPKILKAQELSGLKDAPPSWSSRNKQYRELEQGLTSVIGSELSKKEHAKLVEVKQLSDKLIEDLGGTHDKAGLSDKLKTEIIKNIDDLEKQSDALYKKIEHLIPPNSEVDPRSIRAGIIQKAKKKHPTDLQKGIERLSPLEKELLKIADEQPTYSTLDEKRSAIGQALRRVSGPYASEAEGNLKYLYSLLTSDQEREAANISQEAADYWKIARGLVSQRKTLEDESIYLLGRDRAAAIMPKLGRSLVALGKGDYGKFDEIIKRLPPKMREEAMVSALNDVFVSAGKREQQISFNDFNKWYEGLTRQPSAKRRVIKNLPKGAAARLKTFYTMTQGIETALKDRVSTGLIQTLLKPFEQGGVMEKVYGKTSEILNNTPGISRIAGPVSAMVDIVKRGTEEEPLMKAADRLLSGPEFINAVAAYGDKSARAEAKKKEAEKALVASERYKRWAYNLEKYYPEQYRSLIKSGPLMYFTGEHVESELTQ